MPSSFTGTELAWSIMGFIGLIIALANLRDSILDYRALKLHMNGSGPLSERDQNLCAVARAAIRQEALRSVKMAVVLGIGLIAGFTGPVVPPGVHVPTWTVVGTTITAGLFLIIGIIVLQIVLDRKLRKRFYGRHGGYFV